VIILEDIVAKISSFCVAYKLYGM